MKFPMDNTVSYFTVLFSLFLCIGCARLNSFTFAPSMDNSTQQYNEITRLALSRWKNMEKILHQRTTKAIKNFLVYATADDVNDISSKCLSDIVYVTRGLTTMKFWAYRMIDASSHLPSGILQGTIANFGDYESCMGINVKNKFIGKFCGIRVSPVKFNESHALNIDFTNFLELNKKTEDIESLLKHFMRLIHPYYAFFTFRFEACLPSTCTENDLESLLRKGLEHEGIEWEPSIVGCTTAEEKNAPYDGYELTAIISMSAVLGLAIMGTLLEIFILLQSEVNKSRLSSNLIVRLLLCFSVITNTRRLLKKDDNPESIKVFHGMKSFTILWVILNHTYNNIRPEMMRGSFYIKDVLTSFGFQVVLNGYPTVDTFFFISGVILVYARMRASSSAFSVPLFIFRRVLRLGPGILFVTLAFFVLLRIGDGPVWIDYSTTHANICKKNWWTNIVFVNNMLETRKMCLGWLWYTGADMQLYITALVVMIPIKRKPKLGLWMLGIYAFFSVLAIIVNQIVNNLPPTVVLTAFTNPSRVFSLTEKGYYPFYVHMIAYCVGMGTGYVMYWKPKFRIPIAVNIFGWVMAILFGLSVVYGVYKWNALAPATTAESVIYATGAKIAWALALAWVTIICFSGNGGFIANFLSSRCFVPISRLTYSTYLVHMLIELYFLFGTKTPLDARHKTLSFLYVSFVVLSFMLAFAFSQLFEAPFMNLEKMLLGGRISKAASKPNGKANGQAIDDNNINNAIDYGEKGIYVSDTNKANLEYKSEVNSSSL